LAPFAVARNEEFVPRDTYEDCRIDPGDRIDIVHPTAGG
jgi:thiamine biosynthesis protein ThiS